jgi:phospho-N-acetylmuramoyl-pentapeptide-transferase
MLLGRWFIKLSQKRYRSTKREWTPDRHSNKNETPTMGGLFIISVAIVSTLVWSKISSVPVATVTLSMILFGAIGLIDDLGKLKRSWFRSELSISKKFLLQLVAAFAVAVMIYFATGGKTGILIPLSGGKIIDLGKLAIIWMMLVIVASSNAVNLTDGLDGLATFPLILSFSTYAGISYIVGNKIFSKYLMLQHTQSNELTVLCFSVVGALIGFLWYNTYPAQIFMGDIGSLSLGAALGTVALLSKQELLLIITGGIFVIETASVIVQITSYKLFKKKLFLMTPIHHHFEMLGWDESKITVRFWIVSTILSILSVLILKLY